MTRGVGIQNHDPSAPVALTQWEDGGRAVEEALDKCDALAGFDPNMKVFIKPNLVEYVPKEILNFSPYGILTTSVVLEGIIRYLKDAGAKDITIAEGALINEEFKCGTSVTYKELGYDVFTERYGVKLLDLADTEFEKVGLGGFSLHISKTILEDVDFFINAPVLKTHEQTIVSLGFKNNKGCLSTKSKQICHHRKRLIDEFVARLGMRLYPHLTVIDGIYSLENGPMHMGFAHRENLIVASRDMYSCDCVGATLMGFDPSEIVCLSEFAEEYNRSLNVEDIEVRGLNVSDHIHKIHHLDVNDSWHSGSDVPDFFTKAGVKGFRMPHPYQTLCTGCSMMFPLAVLLIIQGSMAKGGEPYDDYELLGGKIVKPSGHANKTFLLGECITAANRKGEGIKEAVKIAGCPPSFEEMLQAFNENGIKCDKSAVDYFFNNRAKSYAKKGVYRPEHYFMKGEK